MLKPNLFIVGAPKAGTTFLFENLKKNENFFFPKIKELNHFSATELQVNSYYNDYKVKNLKAYLKCFKAAKSQKYIVDGSVSYFAYPTVPKKIFDFNPQSKVVIILRDPIKRAFSHYKMDERMGYAHRDFKQYIQNKNEYPFHFHQYIANSMYAKNIQNYIDVFGESNVLLLKLENLKQEFVNLSSFTNVEDIKANWNTNDVVNPNKTAKNRISKALQKNRNITSKLKYIVPDVIIEHTERFLYKPAKNIKMKPEENDLLKELFFKDGCLLKERFNIEF